MSFWKKLKDLFGGSEETGKEAEKTESAAVEDAPIGKDEPCHFTITFRHSTKSIDFEGTWRGIEEMSGTFADSRGLKMNNFYVPWDEVAFIYCDGRVADDKKEEGKEEDLSKAKPGDEVPATDAAKALGAETMEILPGDGKEEAKAEETKADEAKPEGKAEANKEEPKEEAADATRDARVDEVKAEATTEFDGISAEEIR